MKVLGICKNKNGITYDVVKHDNDSLITMLVSQRDKIIVVAKYQIGNYQWHDGHYGKSLRAAEYDYNTRIKEYIENKRACDAVDRMV